jgi:hypothetical protein
MPAISQLTAQPPGAISSKPPNSSASWLAQPPRARPEFVAVAHFGRRKTPRIKAKPPKATAAQTSMSMIAIPRSEPLTVWVTAR